MLTFQFVIDIWLLPDTYPSIQARSIDTVLLSLSRSFIRVEQRLRFPSRRLPWDTALPLSHPPSHFDATPHPSIPISPQFLSPPFPPPVCSFVSPLLVHGSHPIRVFLCDIERRERMRTNRTPSTTSLFLSSFTSSSSSLIHLASIHQAWYGKRALCKAKQKEKERKRKHSAEDGEGNAFNAQSMDKKREQKSEQNDQTEHTGEMKKRFVLLLAPPKPLYQFHPVLCACECMFFSFFSL